VLLFLVVVLNNIADSRTGSYFICFLDNFLKLGGHDDKKLMIPTTVILRHMFTPAELRVSS
jgi:hypothetical protein